MQEATPGARPSQLSAFPHGASLCLTAPGCPARKKNISSKSFISTFRPSQFLLLWPAGHLPRQQGCRWLGEGAQPWGTPGGGGTLGWLGGIEGFALATCARWMMAAGRGKS